MLQIDNDFRKKVATAIISRRQLHEGTDEAYAKSLGLNNTIFSRIKKGQIDGILSDSKWLYYGSLLDVRINERPWKIVRTDVLAMIEEEVLFCKEFSKGGIFVDISGIGKTVAARYISRTVKNVFYIDAKQYKTKNLFIRNLARIVGLDNYGRYADVKQSLKYYLTILTKPVVIVDDAGYMDYHAYMDLLEMMDATENSCGWYQIGDDSLQNKLTKGIDNKKIGYRAMFSRNGNRYSSIVPLDRSEKIDFFRGFLKMVLSANAAPGVNIDKLVNKSMRSDNENILGDLRRAESLLILNRE